jgi:hypothetical protein
VRLIGHPKAENEEAGCFTSWPTSRYRAGLLRVADDLIDPGNRPDCKFAFGFGISNKLKA